MFSATLHDGCCPACNSENQRQSLPQSLNSSSGHATDLWSYEQVVAHADNVDIGLSTF